MNGRERLTAIFEKRAVDRPSLKLWGLSPNLELMHPAYAQVRDLAMEVTDLMAGASSPSDTVLGTAGEKIIETFTVPGKDAWEDITTIVHTPLGDLRGVYRSSRDGSPGYRLEHLVKQASDLEALLSVAYEPYPFSMGSYLQMDEEVGGRGICLYSLDNAIYALQRNLGPELFALMSIESPELLERAVSIYSSRIRIEAERVLDAGFKPVFGWVGPEICIPPLMSPASFERFVMKYDKPLCDLIHARGGHVWVHCHGRVSSLVDRFIHMGVDVLNPLEPPPMGDVNLSDLAARHGDAIGLEGNIETHDLWTASPDHMEELVVKAVADGSGSGRFILCPSAGFMEFPNPTARYIGNLMIYLNVGFRELTLRTQSTMTL
jgi:hypothetical protein